MKPYKIAIDGPAGVGKSSTADLVARRLGFKRINSGDIYRTITLYFLHILKNKFKNADIYKEPDNKDRYDQDNNNDNFRSFVKSRLSDLDMVRNTLSTMKIDFKNNSYWLNGEPCSAHLHTPEIDSFVSEISKIREVREKAREVQHCLVDGASHMDGDMVGVIMDGRDIGTVVLPDADLKIFLTADPEIRAKRRYKEIRDKGKNKWNEDKIKDGIKDEDEMKKDSVNDAAKHNDKVFIEYKEEEKINEDSQEYLSILKSIQERDFNDMNRKIAPLKRADDAVLVDSGEMTLEEVVAKIVKIFAEKVSRDDKNC